VPFQAIDDVDANPVPMAVNMKSEPLALYSRLVSGAATGDKD